MGVNSRKYLIVELIGRSSNIILTDGDRLIIDCLRRVGGEFSSLDKRAVLPGLIYRRPPAQEGKTDPLTTTSEQWQALYKAPDGTTVDKWLLSAFTGLSPLICRELSWRAYANADVRMGEVSDGGEALQHEFLKLTELASSGVFEPWAIMGQDNRPHDFSYTRIMQYEGVFEVKPEEGFSVMLDGFYTKKAQLARINQRATTIVKTVKTARDRLVRKLAAQKAELEATANRGYLRECGDIITANLHIISKGQSVLHAQDFFSDKAEMRTITLDPRKTPQQNAAKYYKNYTKARNAERFLTDQILHAEKELQYLESVIDETGLAGDEHDLREIRHELVHTGYLKQQKQSKPDKSGAARLVPMQFESSTGISILAGKNNMQNDKLTLKTAAKSDIWLHTQKIHGSHVIISCGGATPDETTLKEAAAIAAYYSSARSEGKVPVDYTHVKHVKKMAGGRPGMVVYTSYKTIIAVPDEALVKRLQVKNN